MKSYAIGLLSEVTLGPPIVEYLQRIDSTSAPYEGLFIVHGDEPDVLEGSTPGAVIIIEFPDRSRAEEWYRSPAYQDILELRSRNSVGTILLIDGVGREHRATDVLK